MGEKNVLVQKNRRNLKDEIIIMKVFHPKNLENSLESTGLRNLIGEKWKLNQMLNLQSIFSQNPYPILGPILAFLPRTKHYGLKKYLNLFFQSPSEIWREF